MPEMVEQAVERDIRRVVGQWPYTYARQWAVTPWRGIGKTRRD